MGIYDMWRKMKLKELEKNNNLKTFYELTFVESRHSFGGTSLFGAFTALFVLMCGYTVKITSILTGNVWSFWDSFFIIGMTLFLIVFSFVVDLLNSLSFQKKMQKELEAKK